MRLNKIKQIHVGKNTKKNVNKILFKKPTERANVIV